MTLIERIAARFGFFRSAPPYLQEASILVTGFHNPVRAAEAFIRSLDVPMDKVSFDRVAAAREDVPFAGGFVIRGYDDLQRLCEIGEFVVAQLAGVVVAMLPGEFVEQQ